MRQVRLRHRFVDFIPGVLEEGVLYVSIEYMTVAHKCCCGCESEVSTPLSPTDWRLIFDGRSVSLEPSIGSWCLPCRSHYWIRNNQVRWAPKWTEEQIQAGRMHSMHLKQAYFKTETTLAPNRPALSLPTKTRKRRLSWWDAFASLFRQQ